MHDAVEMSGWSAKKFLPQVDGCRVTANDVMEQIQRVIH